MKWKLMILGAVVITLLASAVMSETTINPLTRGLADQLYCLIDGSNCALGGGGSYDLNITSDDGNGVITDGEVLNFSGGTNITTKIDGNTLIINFTETIDLLDTNETPRVDDILLNISLLRDSIPANDTNETFWVSQLLANVTQYLNHTVDTNISDTNETPRVDELWANVSLYLLDTIGINYWHVNGTDLEVNFTASGTNNIRLNDQLVVQAGNGQIVSSNSAGSIDVQTSAGEAGSISFGNSADIGLARDGVVGDYNYNGAFIIKQKTSKPVEDGEFIFIEQAGDWRFALPKSLSGLGTYNPRSMIVAGPSVNNGSNFQCGYWGFDALACDTSGEGADLGVQHDLQVLGAIHAYNWTNVTINESQIYDLTHTIDTNETPRVDIHEINLTNLHNAMLQNNSLFLQNVSDATHINLNITDNIIMDTNTVNLTSNGTCFFIYAETSTSRFC